MEREGERKRKREGEREGERLKERGRERETERERERERERDGWMDGWMVRCRMNLSDNGDEIETNERQNSKHLKNFDSISMGHVTLAKFH